MTTAQGAVLVDAMCDALQASGARLSALLREVRDAGRPAIGSWTVAETANHAAGAPQYFLELLRGMREPVGIDEVDADNARLLEADPERDPRVLADRLDDGIRALVTHARGLGADPVARPFTGIDVPVSAVLGTELGEVLVHGHDVARGSGLPWRIEPAEAVLALRGLLPFLPFVVDRERARGIRMRMDLRIRGMERHLVSLDDGRLTVGPGAGDRVDCHVSADPVAYLLLSFNRIRPWPAMLRGRLVLWGRRPWVAATFPSLLQT